MKLATKIGLALAACLLSFGAMAAYVQPLGGSIFPLVNVTQPVTNLSDAYNEMLGLINAQVTGSASGTANDLISNDFMQSTATLTATSNTTLASVTGLSVPLTGSGVYNFHIHLNGTSGASGGLKVAMGGTATATAFNSTCWDYNGTTINAVTNQTTLGSSMMANTAAYTDLVCEGSVTVNAAGTFLLQAAQNASNGTATTVLVGSQMSVQRVM